MEHLFIADTNLFFECKRLEEVSWADLGVDPVIIALTKPVIGEIDKHKRSGGRTQRRALKLSAHIRKMLSTEQNEDIIRDATPRVILRLIPLVLPDPELKQALDYTQNDDCIVGIVSALSKNERFASVTMLTHDGLAASTALSLKLSFRLIPDTWIRPPVETTEAKRIKDLEKDLAIYRAQEPDIDLREIANDGAHIRVVRRVAQALGQEEIDRLLNELQTRHPLQTNFAAQPTETLADGTEISYQAPEPEAVETYTAETYPNWFGRCHSILGSLHEGRIEQEPTVRLTFGLANNGTRPASQMRLSFEALGEIRLRRPSQVSENDGRDDEPTSRAAPGPLPRLPSPPKAPETRRILKRPALPAADLDISALRAPVGSELSKVFAGNSIFKSLHAVPSAFSNLERLSDLSEIVSATEIEELLRVSREKDALFNSVFGSFPDRNLNIDRRHLDLPMVPDISVTKERDPEGFYYDDWPSDVPVKRGALTCELFRHRRGEELFKVEVLFPQEGNMKGAVLCTVHAENLTEPVALRIPVSRIIEEYVLLEAAEMMVAGCTD